MKLDLVIYLVMPFSATTLATVSGFWDLYRAVLLLQALELALSIRHCMNWLNL